ncbi:MAG: DUF4097 family beta strand repeat-containing protein [Lachnospiraceae bacterium]
MSKSEFYDDLFARVNFLEQNEVEQLKEYYEELICDGMEAGASEEEVIDKLENPESVAQRLIIEYGQGKRNRSRSRGTREGEQGLYTSEDTVKRLVIHAKDRGIIFKKSMDNKVRIYCRLDDSEEVIYHESDGCFFFRQDTRRSLRFMMFGIRRTYPIEVELPEELDSIEVETTNGGIRGEDIHILEEVKFRTSNGGIRMDTIECKKILATTENAGINLTDANGEELIADTCNGRVSLERAVISKEIQLRSSNGGVVFDRIDCPNINLRTSNGMIKGALSGTVGDYAIRSRTSNGSTNLPNISYTDQKKKLSAITSNGRIQVEFYN